MVSHNSSDAPPPADSHDDADERDNPQGRSDAVGLAGLGVADVDPDDPLLNRVCFCHAVSETEIRGAIRDGAKTLEAVQAKTKASTGCGGCTCEVERILAEEGTG